MKTKLLDRTLRVYGLYSIIILLVSAPLFYSLMDRLYLDEADETLLLRKKEFIANNLPSMSPQTVVRWNSISRDLKIEGLADRPEKDSLFDAYYFDSLDNELEPYRVLRTPISLAGNPYTLMARFNLVESGDMVMNVALLFCLILIVLLVGLYFITRYLSQSLWRPFYSMLGRIERFDLDKNEVLHLADTEVEEFSRLNVALDNLLENNRSAYRHQREFIENAAHELQTPVAVIQAKLDLLVQQVALTEEVGKTLTALNDATSRLSRINRNLLLLSKMDRPYPEASSSPVMVDELIRKQGEFLIEQALSKEIRVEIGGLDPLTIVANRTLLEIAVNNLLLNALRYTPQQGTILVALENRHLSVSNTGIHPLDQDKLFRRFAATATGDGSGLGLSIVKRIVELHEWSVAYAFEKEQHRFQITFDNSKFIPNRE